MTGIMAENVVILDPSDRFRPEKDEQTFRNYTQNGEFYGRVKKAYDLMHTNQTYEFANKKKEYWTQFNHGELSVLEALTALNALVDESDPDCDVPNSVHAFQTAERIREKHPDADWFHLTGLIHDIGKILAVWGEPQFSTVGDTFVTGCAPVESIVFGRESFANNPDNCHPVYSTKLGIYEENCGLENVTMSWGHDEYMYHVMRHNNVKLPEEAFYIVRFHSFYPWHTGGNYEYFTNNKDQEMKKWILEFNKFDLYSKADEAPIVDELLPYYQSLIDKYMPGRLKW